MATQTDIPDLTNDDKAAVFQVLDAKLNSQILYALVYGIYTGILAVTLWTSSTNAGPSDEPWLSLSFSSML
ncbi:hypothetical protein ARMSODRAFT_1017593 [Armillaria solidipes]|uniref:Uncharacterized protein n=1 Tax=Armillaria solidipes TaxID=1076256 RepID=A0A2H3BIW8_9AGAR|nr:hypothetical protein ARMSODRAFT_1017593 [Armillaria solidipes]